MLAIAGHPSRSCPVFHGPFPPYSSRVCRANTAVCMCGCPRQECECSLAEGCMGTCCDSVTTAEAARPNAGTSPRHTTLLHPELAPPSGARGCLCGPEGIRPKAGLPWGTVMSVSVGGRHRLLCWHACAVDEIHPLSPQMAGRYWGRKRRVFLQRFVRVLLVNDPLLLLQTAPPFTGSMSRELFSPFSCARCLPVAGDNRGPLGHEADQSPWLKGPSSSPRHLEQQGIHELVMSHRPSFSSACIRK